MKILGIESSCDDTSIALLDITDNLVEILAEVTASQIEVHKKYGGVVPEIAGRKHAEKIMPCIEHVLAEFDKPDYIAVTAGPGLITALMVGVEAAKTLSYIWDIPIIAVNHIEGHILSPLLGQAADEAKARERLAFPALALVVSGGHTELILMKDFGDYEKLGATRDDASGEAFDKAAKMLGLSYPGGPKISKHAADGGDPHKIPFPRPMMHSKDLDFSFAGLKTAALYWLRDNGLAAMNPLNDEALQKLGNDRAAAPATINDFCASYEQAIIDVLVSKTEKAATQHKAKTVLLGGGVSANRKLRDSLAYVFGDKLLIPEIKYAMDNAAMIAFAAYEHAKKGETTDWRDLDANTNWKVYDK